MGYPGASLIFGMVPFLVSGGFGSERDRNSTERDGGGWLSRLSGSLRFEYKSRWTPDESDQDIFSSLSLNYGDSAEDGFSFSVFGSFSGDLDGRSRSPANASDSTLFHVRDTFSDNFHGELFRAYLQWNQVVGIERVRVGRQELLTTLPAWFDGGSIRLDPLNRTSLLFYGGVPVNLYESSTDGDSILGVQLRSTPLRWDFLGETTIAAEYQRYVDDNRDFGEHRDDLVSFRTWQQVAEYGEVEGAILLLEGHVSDWSVAARGRLEELGISFDGHYKKHPLTTRDHSDRYTEYFAVLGALERFEEYGLRVHKGLAERFGVEAGFRSKRLLDGTEENRSNSDFTRYFWGFDAQDYPLPGVSGSVFADLWKSSGNDEFFVGFDVDWKVTDRVRLRGGSSYSEFKYDTDDLGNLISLGSRRDRVRDLFFGVRYDVSARLRVRVRYAVERSEIDTVNTLSVVLVQDF